MLRCVLFLLLATSTAFAQLTDNHVLHAVPVPATVTIDGNLSDWDLSGKIFSCPNVETLRQSTSAYVAMMYDAEALYVGIDWADTTPMLNNYDPLFERRFCFHSDSIQLHFQTDVERQVFGWYYTKEKAPAISVTEGRQWYDARPIVYLDETQDLGIKQAFAEKTDHKGYFQEIRIPWKAIHKDPAAAPKAGDTIKCMLDLVWGPDSGKGWPATHLMDLVKPGAAHGDWFWNVRDIHGNIVLEPKGNLDLPPITFAAAKSRPAGPVALRATIPVSAKRFTLAINDQGGGRIRNLAGDFDPADFTVAQTADSRTVEVRWDCLDDQGKLVPPGTYNVLGLTHTGLSANYDMHFYNPGTPPWETRDSSGGWGADHTPPTAVAAAGNTVAIAWSGAEGGSGVIAVGPSGKKVWGTLKGTTALAADENFVYAMTSDFWAGTSGLGRLRVKDGSYDAYLADNKPTFPLPLEVVFRSADKVPGTINALAVYKNTLALAMSDSQIALLDARTARLQYLIPSDPAIALAYAPDGSLYMLTAGKIRCLAPVTGAAPVFTNVDLPDLAKPAAIAFDAAGHLAVADAGPDSQVKLYDVTTRKLLSTFGQKGGRALRGIFNPLAMANLKSIAFDNVGQLWVVESHDIPRRVSVWAKDGAFVRDYIGNTAYAGGGAYLHDSDPTLAFVGPLEFKLDRKARTSALTQILWQPDPAAGELFSIGYEHNTAQRFTATIAGEPREYFYSRGAGHVVYMPRGKDGAWQPVAALFQVHHVSGFLDLSDSSGKNDIAPTGDYAGMNLRDGFIWSDQNRDGKVQRAECILVPAKGPEMRGNQPDGHGLAATLKLDTGWGGRMGDDLSIYADGIVRYKPASYTDDGAPVYDSSSIQPLGVADRGDIIPVDSENKLLVCSGTGYGRTSYIRALDLDSKAELWRFPLYHHGVHGSHNAAMPEPGKPIGVIKLLGAAPVSTAAGAVVALRGNLGQDYFLTTDGLYVGALFHDARIPSPPFPAKLEDIYDADLTEASEGSEPFNGWFGRQSDGKIRMCNGMAGQAGTSITMHGFESIERFTAPSVSVDQPTLVLAEAQSATQPAAASKTYALRKLTASALLAGKPIAWPNGHPVMSLNREGTPNSAQIRLGYDDANLYAEFRVADTTPFVNEGKDLTRLFKTGDACDLQLSIDPAAQAHAQPIASDLRLVFSKDASGALVCVLMQPVDPTAPADKHHIYASPVGKKSFDRVEVLPDVRLAVTSAKDSYTLTATIPLASLHLALKPGTTLRADAGVIYSDAQGTTNTARVYWANPATNLVSDLPHEAWLYPATWGTLVCE